MIGMLALVVLLSCNDQQTESNSETSEPEVTELVLADDGAWGYTGHHALMYRNKLFYSYLDSEGNTWVASYDPVTGDIVRSNIWEGEANLHSSNALVIRPDGRIQVFLDAGSYVDNKIRWKVSNESGEVAEFGDLQISEIDAPIVQGRQFYPVVHNPTGMMFLAVNAIHENSDRTAMMWISEDGGDSFNQVHELWSLGKDLRSNRSYTRVYAEDSGIHFATVRVGWNESVGEHEIGRVEGVYYIKYDVSEQAFIRASGEHSFELTDLPIFDADKLDNVWHWVEDGGGTSRALWSDIVADENGRPYVAFAVQNAVPQGVSTFHDGYWAHVDDRGEWSHHHIGKLARGWDNRPERKNYGLAIDPIDPMSVIVSRSTDFDQDLSRVVRMRSGNRGEDWTETEILSDEGRITTVVIPRLIDDSERSVAALWLEGRLEGWFDYNTGIKATPSNP